MTTRELSQLYWLDTEIANDKQRVAELERAAASPASPELSGMPHAPHNGASKVERQAVELADFKTRLEAKIQERNRLNRFIDEIPDSLTRMVFTYRFRQNMRWKEVARGVGGRNTAETVKKICMRYLERVMQ